MTRVLILGALSFLVLTAVLGVVVGKAIKELTR